jgi:hypothetical protein
MVRLDAALMRSECGGAWCVSAGLRRLNLGHRQKQQDRQVSFTPADASQASPHERPLQPELAQRDLITIPIRRVPSLRTPVPIK